MELFAVVFDVEVEGNVALSEVFHFEKGRVDLAIEVVEDEYFP